MCKDTIESRITKVFAVTCVADKFDYSTFISVDFVPDEVNFRISTTSLANEGQCFVVTSSLMNGNEIGYLLNNSISKSTYNLKKSVNGSYTFWFNPTGASSFDANDRIIVMMEFIRYK